jgi:hypothetical protein
VALEKTADTPDSRLRLARRAVASALDLPASDDWPATPAGEFVDVTPPAGRPVRVAVLPRGGALAATTLCEAAP